MQPRRLRLGDVVDDYCSRCRLLSNHAIAAIVDDVIKQTRCSTCDFEHPYKDGKLPARRTRKDATSALYKQVLDNVTDGAPEDTAARPAAPLRPALARPEPPRPADLPDTSAIETPAPPPAPAPTLVRPAAPSAPSPRPAAAAPAPAPLAAAPEPPAEEPRPDADEGIVHRRLIRATLPRVEGAEREARPIPVFTVHEAANARGKFRRFPRPAGHGYGNGNGNFNGNGNGNAMPRFGHGGQPSPFGAQGRGHGKGGGQHPNRGGQQHGNRNQRRGNKGR